jgi:hypothetical protein
VTRQGSGKKRGVWDEITKRMMPQLPDRETLVRWIGHLNKRLASIREGVQGVLY